MRRELVADALEDIRQDLFSDVIYTPLGGNPVTIDHAIFGPEIATEEHTFLGAPSRLVTHVAYAPIALFPSLTKGDQLAELDDTGTIVGAYKVIDCKPWGDGRLEWAISLAVA